MTDMFEQYIQDTVLRTESNDILAIRERLLDPARINSLIYAPMRRFVEAGLELDRLKKRAFYGTQATPDPEKDGWSPSIQQREAPIGSVLTQLDKPWIIRLFHAVLGIGTESAELIRALMLYIFVADELKKQNVIEELGDVMWYIGILCNLLGVSLEQVLEANRKKLRERYPDKFSEDKAIHRDLQAEERVLDKAISEKVATGCRRGCPVPKEVEDCDPQHPCSYSNCPRCTPGQPVFDGDEVDSLTVVEANLHKPPENTPTTQTLLVGKEIVSVPIGFLAYYRYTLAIYREERRINDPVMYGIWSEAYGRLAEQTKAAWTAAAHTLQKTNVSA